MSNKLLLTGTVLGAIATAGGAFAKGEGIVSSKAYVDSGVSQKQNIISKAADANTAMLFPTTTGGTLGQRVISTEVGNDTNLVTRGGVNTALNTKQETVNGVTGSAYTGQASNLVEAQHVNGAVGFNAHLTCANQDCSLYNVNTLNASTTTYVPHGN